jgi:hypothetical protein
MFGDAKMTTALLSGPVQQAADCENARITA